MSEGAALLDGLPGGLFGDVLGLHLWGLVFSATIGEALKGARESRIELRAPTVRASLFPLRLHARPVRARAKRHRARPVGRKMAVHGLRG